MYRVVRESRSIYDPIPRKSVFDDTKDDSFFAVLAIAEKLAKEHAERLSGVRPIRIDNGFQFNPTKTDSVHYKAEEVN